MFPPCLGSTCSVWPWRSQGNPCFRDDSPAGHPGVLLRGWTGGVLAEAAQVKLLMTIISLSCALGLSRAWLGTPGSWVGRGQAGSCRSPVSGEHCWGKSTRVFGLSWGKINTWVTTGSSAGRRLGWAARLVGLETSFPFREMNWLV